MRKWWQGLIYTCEGVVILGAVARVVELGAVTRESGVGPWQAWRFHINRDNEFLGDFDTMELAMKAVERSCE
jgi:hypothetical protein